jgi:NADH-quinone oxidoreductase subunit N
LISILCLSIISKSFIVQNLNFSEFFTLYLLALFSLFLLLSSYNFISFYLTLEMQTLVFYTLAAFKRNSFFSVEAGLKYFISGSFISGLFLMGVSILYIALGTLNFYYFDLLFTIPFSFFNSTYLFFLDFGIILIIVTFLFKLGCAPFHF